jgi:TRAP-type mannitol/chloroaromatic compound transport system permease large subunit
MKTTVPSGISLVDIYKSIIPFVVIQVISLVLAIFFPSLVTFLPRLIID